MESNSVASPNRHPIVVNIIGNAGGEPGRGSGCGRGHGHNHGQGHGQGQVGVMVALVLHIIMINSSWGSPGGCRPLSGLGNPPAPHSLSKAVDHGAGRDAHPGEEHVC